MTNRRMTSGQALSLIRKLARKDGYSVTKLGARGKGSHEMYALLDSSGKEVDRFGLTGHPSKDLSWTMLNRLEERLAPLFGERWTEKR